jgi:hypothetical protein
LGRDVERATARVKMIICGRRAQLLGAPALVIDDWRSGIFKSRLPHMVTELAMQSKQRDQ